jgi:predicted CXXCH cytochrome family protein
MKTIRVAALAALIMAVAGFTSAARANVDEETRKANDECLACHSEGGLKNPPRPDMNLRGLARLLVSGERFEKSVHGEEACKDCHGESYVKFPHDGNSRYQIKTCPDCHKSVGRQRLAEFQQTLHYKNHPLAFTCQSCHDPHALQLPKQLGSAKRVAAQDNTMCRDCHDSDYRWGQFTTRPRPNLLQVHRWQPNPELHWQSVRCIDCHTPPTERGTSHLIVGKDKAERDCSACHNASSSLRTRLYRYFNEQQLESKGFLNAALLGQAYVVGATRNAWLDTATWIITGLVAGGIALHALFRILSAILRKGRQ